ncbi:MAG: NADH-quinone oxidoreductase subunit NuoH [Candidatus Kryptoniota bacterium]
MDNFVISKLGSGILSSLLSSLLPLLWIFPYALFAIWLELKVAAHMQDRLGPMRTGRWHGWLQPVADVVKLLQKEDVIASATDRVLFVVAPIIVFAASYAVYAAIPFSPAYIGTDINVGIFYIIAMGALVSLGILMAGWASNNKWSLLGAMRTVAQLVSYEIPSSLAVLSVIMVAGTLSLQDICKAQEGWFWNWIVFSKFPFMVLAFFIYFVASLAETNRVPFDIPEGESELVAGYHTEYSGMRFAVFFLAEYSNMFVVSAITAVLFFGGWNSPFGNFMSGPVWGVFWLLSKGMFFVFVQMWLRWTLPRFRVDQLMYLSWKVLTPFALANIAVIGLWVMLRG